MSNILVVAATAFEIAPLLSQKQQLHIDTLVTGVGQLATTYHLGQALAAKKYDWVINAGIAGSFRSDWPLGEVVEVVSEQMGDLGIEEADGTFRDMFEIGFLAKDEFPFHEGRLHNPYLHTTLSRANGLTINRVHGFAPNIEAIKAKYNPDIESMEGAAFFYVCMQQRLKCTQLRSISNYVEPRNRAAWKIPLAIERLNEQLLAMCMPSVA